MLVPISLHRSMMLWRCARAASQYHSSPLKRCLRDVRTHPRLSACSQIQHFNIRYSTTSSQQQSLTEDVKGADGRGAASSGLLSSQEGELVEGNGLLNSATREADIDASAENVVISSSEQIDTMAKLQPHAAIRKLKGSTTSTIKMNGLIRSIRKQKNLAFAHISDGSTSDLYQALFQPASLADGISNGSYVEFEGNWIKSTGTKQSHELQVEKVLTIGSSEPEVSPLQKKYATVDHLRNYPHMRLRLDTYAELNKARARAISSAHSFYAQLDNTALYVQPPIITSSDCEGAGEVFTLTPKAHDPTQKKKEHYFRTPKYLTVSSQLHLEAFSAELGNVWTIAPAFRAEQSDTGRHLSELWMLETELRGSDVTLDTLTSHVSHLVTSMANSISSKSFPQDRLEALKTFKSMTYTAIMSELEAWHESHPKFFNQKPTWDGGLALEHEKWITEHCADNTPIFITNYPRAQKPFYMLPDPDCAPDRETVSCFDLLLPHVCETVGGSLREHRLEHLIDAMREKGLLKAPKAQADETATSQKLGPLSGDAIGLSEPEIREQRARRKREDPYPFLREGESLGSLRWYADLRRFGSSPHGGFGLGLDRLLMYITGVGHVRDIVPFPRTWRNCIA